MHHTYQTIRLYACLTVCFCYSGIGISLTVQPCQVIIQHYFNRNRGLATGIVPCGVSIAGLACGPYVRLLIDTYGWRGALLLHAGIVLQGVVFSCAFLPVLHTNANKESQTLKQSTRQSSCCCITSGISTFFNCSLLTNANFVCYTLGTFFLSIGYSTFHQHEVCF